MRAYKGKAICERCRRRARWVATRPGTDKVFACVEHKEYIASLPDPPIDHGHMTEADYQTWHALATPREGGES